MRNVSLFLLMFSVIFAACDLDPKHDTPEDLLIGNNEISGWSLTDNFWTATNTDELTDNLYGEAATLSSYGFVEAAYQEYEGRILGNIEQIQVTIFDQGKNKNAAAIFDYFVNKMSSPIDWQDGAGEEAKYDRFSIKILMCFFSSRYFVELSISSGQDEALAILQTFAKNIDNKIN